MRKALLVIDVQNYFMNEHTRGLPGRIAAYLRHHPYSVVLFTQFINDAGSSFQKIFGWANCRSPPDTDLHPAMAPWIKANNVFTKNGYSAFKSKALRSFLKNEAISEIDVCGTDTEACVLVSAFEGFELGFRIKVLHELCASTNGAEFHNYGRAILQRNLEKAPG